MLNDLNLHNAIRCMCKNTSKFVAKKLAVVQQQLLNPSLEEDEINELNRDEKNLRHLLAGHHTYNPIEQKEVVMPGNAVLLELDGVQKKVFVDGCAVGEGVVGLSSPLGRAIFNQRVGAEGFYHIPKGETKKFKILSIELPSEAKKMFKKKQHFMPINQQRTAVNT